MALAVRNTSLPTGTCRSPGWLQRKPRWPTPGTQPSEVANRKPAVGLALRRSPGRGSDQGTLVRAGTAADGLYCSDPGSVGAADQFGSGCGTARRPIPVAGPTRRISNAAAGEPVVSGLASPRSARSAENAGLPQRSARPALAARAARRQSQQRAVPRNSAAAQPAEFALAGWNLPRQIPCRTGKLREKNRIGALR